MIIKLKNGSNLPGFTPDAFYRPLEVSFNSGSKTYRLIGDKDVKPGLYSGKDFNVIDARFYADWIMAVQSQDNALLTWKEFLEPGFWENYSEGKSEAVQAYNRIVNPLADASLTIDFVQRVKSIPWATVHSLVQNKWLSAELSTHLATPKLEISESNELEKERAGLGVRDSARVLELLTFLSPRAEGKKEAALLLAAWGYENRATLRDPILFLEDVYLKYFPAAELKAAMPFLNAQIPNEDIFINWKAVLDAYVYGKILAP